LITPNKANADLQKTIKKIQFELRNFKTRPLRNNMFLPSIVSNVLQLNARPIPSMESWKRLEHSWNRLRKASAKLRQTYLNSQAI